MTLESIPPAHNVDVCIVKPFHVHAPWHPAGTLCWGHRYALPAAAAVQLEREGRAILVSTGEDDAR